MEGGIGRWVTSCRKFRRKVNKQERRRKEEKI